MNVKLIAFDLDGTLLDDDKHLPPENLAALQAAHMQGIFLVPATGRILKALPEELLAPGLFRYFIFANGALVYDLQEQQALYRARIEPELAVRLCTYMDTLPVLYDCYRGDCGYMTQWMYDRAPEFFETEPHILKLVKSLRRPVPDLKQKIQEDGLPLEKLQMFFRPEHMDERARQLELVPQLFPELIASSSLRNNIEINSARAGKGNALRALCEKLDLDTSESVAFGDGLNDADMLRAAGRGCAMQNAIPAVKEAADVTVETNNDAGVGKEIFRLLRGAE
ncbi:MAG: Cof-type HAD-IIB family hydrolase [Oscillospiraceae bacterium]|nr:Cof-type HAD-IIB family hydrolase [Oscillospiraceae bacterium]